MPTFTLGVLLAAGIAAGAGAVRAIRDTRALYPEPLPLPVGEPSDTAALVGAPRILLALAQETSPRRQAGSPDATGRANHVTPC